MKLSIEIHHPQWMCRYTDPWMSRSISIGSITSLTYEDTDGSGTISSGDALLPGIPVQIISDDGQHEGMTNTNTQGHFVFEDYPATNYTALFDLTLLPSQWTVVIDSVSSEITTCGDSVIVSLLLTDNC